MAGLEGVNETFVYLHDPSDEQVIEDHRRAGGLWVAHRVGYNDYYTATAWSREPISDEGLTREDIASVTVDEVERRLGVTAHEVRYLGQLMSQPSRVFL